MAKEARQVIVLQCTQCGNRNYATTKNTREQAERLEFVKYCKFDRKHTAHKESK